MSIDRDLDTTRIVRSWLRTDEHESADRVLDSVFALLDATPQHQPWPVRRFADMNSYMKLAIVAAAVAVVAVVGMNLLPRGGGDNVGGVPPSPSPSISASPSASPSSSLRPAPSAITDGFPAAGPIPVGRATFTQEGVRFSVDIPTGIWQSSGIAVAPDGVNITRGSGTGPTAAWMIFWSIDGVYSDPCGHVREAAPGPSAADLAAQVAAMGGVELVSGPTETTVGGRPAQFVSVRVPEDPGCAAGDFFLWWNDVRCDDADPCHRWATTLGETHYVWIIDAGSKRIWIEAETYPGATQEVIDDVHAIVDSLQFE